MLLGYTRVSTKDQNEGRQLKKLKDLGIEDRFIFVDKISGATFDREQYKAMKAVIRKGDLIYMDALDRLGRNYDMILHEWREITRTLEADIVILENEALFDSRKFRAMGDFGKVLEDQFLSMLAYVAEQELKKIRQRQADGIALAKSEGRHLGRPRYERPQKFATYYREWQAGHITAKACMDALGLKRTKFYEFVKEYESEEGEDIVER